MYMEAKKKWLLRNEIYSHNLILTPRAPKSCLLREQKEKRARGPRARAHLAHPITQSPNKRDIFPPAAAAAAEVSKILK